MIVYLLVATALLANAALYYALPQLTQFTQTSPLHPVVCPGERLVFTCVVKGTGGTIVWLGNDGKATLLGLNNNKRDTIDSFVINIDAKSNDTTVISTATNNSVPAELNGANISCSADGRNLVSLTINIADPPVSVTNITINPINNNSMSINWMYQQNEEEHCIEQYVITIISNNKSNYTNVKTITFSSLIIGSNYSFTIIPIDTAGREGPPSSSIQYIWNVPVQVVNVSWYQISNDSLIIWWNNIEDSRPPTDYYNITVYSTTDCINSCIVYSDNVTDTNITITGLSLSDEYYTVTIIPVNIIGYGLSVNVYIPTMVSSSLIRSSTILLTESTPLSSMPSFTHTISSLIPTTIPSTTPPPPTTATATGSEAVPVIAGAIGGIVLLIIIIIIIVIAILVYARRHSGLKKESHTANGSTGEKSAAVSGESWRKNNFELSPPSAGPTDPTYATPTTEYSPAPPVRHIQGGDGPPLYPPPPPGGQYSVLRGDDDDDDIPPPVPPAYNPDGVQEYSVLKREGEKKSQQPLPQGATPLYSTLNQIADTPPPVPAYNPDGVQNTQDYSALKREGENKSQQALPVSLYSTINKDQGQVDESAHKLVYADLSIASKDKRPQPPPTNEQAVLYASVNNQVQSKAPPPVPPPQDKVLYADLSVAGKRTPRTKPRTQPAEDRVLYAAVNGNGINRKSTTQELLMAQIGDLDIPPPIPPKPKP